MFKKLSLFSLIFILIFALMACSSDDKKDNGTKEQAKSYKLEVGFDKNQGTVSISEEKESYAHGEKVTITAKGINGYIFSQWDGKGSGYEGNTSSTLDITMKSNLKLVALFKDASVLTINGLSNNGLYEPGKTFTISGKKEGTIEYSLDGEKTWTKYTKEVTLLNEGIYKISAKQKNKVGKFDKTPIITVTIKKDVVNTPTITGIKSGSYNTAQSFQVLGDKGCTLEYSLDGGNTWTKYASAVTLSKEGTYSVTAKQTNTAGTTSANTTVITVTIKKDVVNVPTITGIKSGSYNTAQSFEVLGDKGCTLEYSLNGGNTWTKYASAVTLSKVGTYNVTAKQTNTAGTTSANTAVITVTIIKKQNISMFPDKNLEKAIRTLINKPTGLITENDVIDIKRLDASNSNISSIEGLQYLKNLHEIELEKNQISDITPLQNLTKLRNLMLSRNNIDNISKLSNLNNLVVIRLVENKVTDISSLATLNKLEVLNLANNKIKNINSLKNLTKLNALDINDNNISNTTPLNNLNSLVILGLGGTGISNIKDILANKKLLDNLDISRNNIKNIDPLLNLNFNNFKKVFLYNNPIDFTPNSPAMKVINQLRTKGVTVEDTVPAQSPSENEEYKSFLEICEEYMNNIK